MPTPSEPVLVVNGDIVTEVDFRTMLAYHQEHDAEMTVGVRHYGIQVPYGVVNCEGSQVKGVSEKPLLSFFVNAGIYILSPGAFTFITRDVATNMTDLIARLNQAGRPVVSFPIIEYWLDIGHPEDFQKAQDDVNERSRPEAAANAKQESRWRP
jgi:NDP-sugar pyrophosphorylase family protein